MKIEAKNIKGLSSKLTSILNELVKAIQHYKIDGCGKKEVDALEIKIKSAQFKHC